MNQQSTRSRPRGFSLIEALVALLVVSFGMLAIAGFQFSLTRSSDLAKQRSEATRLAQQKIESLRAYAQVASNAGNPHIVNYTDDVVSSNAPEVFVSNATFSRTWTVTANAVGTEKWINVQVAWTDRANQQQNVQLLSVISKFDPQDVGTLATGPGGTNVRKPKNRNINIPYPAVTLSGGTQSAFIPPPGNVAYVFDNITGKIVKSCTGLTTTAPVPVAITNLSRVGNTVTVTAPGHSLANGYSVAIAGASDPGFNGQFTVANAVAGATFTYELTAASGAGGAIGGTATRVNGQLLEGLDLANSGATCGVLDAYLLSGYVRFDTSGNPTGAEPGNPGNNNNTLPLANAAPLLLDFANAPTPNNGGDPAMTCYAQRQQVVRTGNTTPVAITVVSRNGSTVTVTAPGHPFVAGQIVAINGTNDAGYTGAFTVASVAGGQFTYRLPPPLPSGNAANGGTAALVERLTIAEGAAVAGYGNLVSKFVAYACVVTPVDHDNVAGTAKRWWGKVTLNPNNIAGDGPTWGIGINNGQYKVCRFSADYNGNLEISNSEHPQWYRKVTGSLDSQNFLVIDQGQSCPVDKPQNLLGNPVNTADDTTASHQPSGERSFQCAAANCNGGNKNVLEPAANDSDLTMD